MKTAVSKSINHLEKRAKAILAMGLVDREGDRFNVSTPSVRGKQTAYIVRRDEAGAVVCTCQAFETAAVNGEAFRCEHILAVKFALTEKNTEPRLKQASETQQPETEPAETTKTESRKSERGEQEAETDSEDASTNRQVETKKTETVQLADTQGDKKMKQNNSQEAAATVTTEEPRDNVLEFSSTLKELRKNVDPHLVKQREGWRDRNGNVQMVDYVEWHTVADILDETAPNWAHTVKDIKQIGDIMTVTVAITINEVTREGVGTGLAQSEMGIKKAEHDALKRAAVKFGIARDLYKKESDAIEREGSTNPGNDDGFPTDPIAKSLSDLVTAKQLGMIRAIARELKVDADEESQSVMNCSTDELSKKAASALIQHLQDLQKQNDSPAQVPLRRVS